LGAQFGCVLIDEINIADIDFVREVSTRNDYLIATLNPDNPDLPVYKEFINRARPYKKYVNDVPESILKELKEEPNPLWRYWFFSFYDNKGLTDEDIQAKIDAAPKGTKLYKNKILGLRGKATGLVFQNFERSRHVISKEAVKRFFQSGKISFIHFTAGLDTAYSSKSDDTISMIFAGVTQDRKLIILDEKVYNNRYLSEPVAPSDTAKNFIDFLERSRNEFGLARNVFVDSADQATITELNKYKRENPCVYIFNNSYKKLKIIDRITLQLGWLHTDDYLVCDCCKNHIGELECYCWNDKRDNEPEDANDHTINAAQYAWIPYKDEIGTKELNSK
ncbi:MAG: terminase, partial [Clostridia bacterium]|nr:terminase [Clostridia bacterium]